MGDRELRTLGLPRQYTQGPGALDALGTLLQAFPGPYAVVLDDIVRDVLGERLLTALEALPSPPLMLRFGGECTLAEIERLTSEAQNVACRAVVAVGGGKTLDCGKGIARRLGLPITVVPTVASNDAPTSRLIVIYDENHAITEVERLPWNPDLVVIDTEVIARSPVRFLRAGIGDAISKRFEAEQVRRARGLNFFGTRPLDAAGLIADQTYRTIRTYAADAIAACERHEVTPALEHLVEAAVLFSGVGFENGGLSIAHALTRGLTAAPATRKALHGEMVAYGLLLQLRLGDGQGELLDDLLDFYRTIGLPRNLGDLGAQRIEQGLVQEIAERTAQAPYIAHFERRLDADAIAQAITEHEAMLSVR
jgi:glycerol dehydrogenase